jgi:nicotinate-nucleotide pyrophosphorylase (carboxylating)
MPLNPLPDVMIEPLVRHALAEDLGRAGDITTDALIPPGQQWMGALVTRQNGVVAGLDFARIAFRLIDPTVSFDLKNPDGTRIEAKSVVADVKGPARAILSAERVALNFLSHLSGIATETRKLVEAVKPYKARICCTRKTTPGLRAAEKYAVRAGGGANHRFGLDDAVLIKDNHIAVAGGIGPAVERVRASVGHLVKIELEVDTLEQVRQALELPIDAVLLDNMPLTMLRQAVEMVQGRFLTEASGRVGVETVGAIAATGVDVISSGSITHSAPILDIGLDEA